MEPKRKISKNVAWMIAIIVMLAVGIALRWDFIRSEVATVVGRMFGK